MASAATSSRAQASGSSAPAGKSSADSNPTQDELALFSTLSAYADALDALPLDLTRSFSDLRELDAVLGTHLGSLTNRLTQLTAIIEDQRMSKGERLLALKEVAEEARAYKMGGEDKIRVALNTAETIISHTTYIDGLLANIGTLPALASFLLPAKKTHLAGHLADGTPLAPGSGPGGNNPAAAAAAAAAVQADVGPSPAKKKKLQGASGPLATTTNASITATASEKRAAQEAAGSSGGPGKKRKAGGQSAASKARAAAAADSDVDTVGSSSTARRPPGKRAKVNGNGMHARDDDGDDHLNASSRSRAARNNRMVGRVDNSDDDGSDTDAAMRRARVARAPRMAHNASDNTIAHASTLAGSAAGSSGGNEDTDERRYCFCNNVSYGDMIGCDDEDCEREWFHLECVGLLKPPQGTWYCDDCAQKRALSNRNGSKNKNRKTVAKTSGMHGGGVVEQKSRSSGSKR